MSEFETLRLKFGLPYYMWTYFSPRRKEHYCPLGNQPSQPFTTHIFWDAINKIEAAMEAMGVTGLENPPKMPGHYLVCFRNKDLAEKFRGFTGIQNRWVATKFYTENILKDAIGNVPFIAFVNEYRGDGGARESGFRWRVCHLVGMGKEIEGVGLDPI